MPDQTVYFSVKLNEKSSVRSRPAAPGDVQRLPKRHVVGKPDDERDHRGQHAEDDDGHLLDVGPRHRLHAAEHRVDRRRHADREDGQGEVPPEHDRQDDGGSRDDHAAGEAAAGEEQQRRQAARLRVEPPLEILVGGVDPRAEEERHHREREDDHRDRQAEVELHEPHAVRVPLPRRAHQRDRAQLRGHHREPGGPPRQAPLGQQVAVHLVGRPRALQPVVDNPRQVGDDDEPVDEVHAVRQAEK